MSHGRRKEGPAGNPEAQHRMREREQHARRQRELDLQALLERPEGRRFIWGQLSATGVHASQFSLNGLANAFNEGRRSVGVELVAAAQRAAPALYLQMIEEAVKRDREDITQQKADESAPNPEAREASPPESEHGGDD